MDWANQPNPFRVYEDAPMIRLGLSDGHVARMPYADLYAPAHEPQPLDRTTIGSFLALSLGLSAWKAVGNNRWSLRIHPSSGNLHPTECYLGIGDLSPLPAGVYHYNSLWHALAQRADLSSEHWSYWPSHFEGDGFWIALTSIFWRESWKYGERAYRYCNLDVGHALAALSFGARLHGWELTCISGAGDDQIRTLLGMDQTLFPALEEEEPDLIGWIRTDAAEKRATSRQLSEELTRPLATTPFKGRPNPLSAQRMHWPIITQAAAAARKRPTAPAPVRMLSGPFSYPPPQRPAAVGIIRQRRSAVRFDPAKTISADAFFSILDRTLPRTGVPPFDVALGTASIDLLIFVHRVQGLDPGLYWLMRSDEPVAHLRALCHDSYAWRPLRDDWPLYLLHSADVTVEAMEVSCHQEIAAQSAFALAMLAPLQRAIASEPYLYRHLHWECGMIGQALYLEAEAQGLRGTGIGCFFDNPLTDLLGLETDTFNSLYHFTVGYALEDQRLQTLPPYHHLQK
jgi:SagB-type dehydrogenase family enzyme